MASYLALARDGRTRLVKDDFSRPAFAVTMLASAPVLGAAFGPAASLMALALSGLVGFEWPSVQARLWRAAGYRLAAVVIAGRADEAAIKLALRNSPAPARPEALPAGVARPPMGLFEH